MRTSNLRSSKLPAFTRTLSKLVSVLALIIGSITLLSAAALAQGPENTIVVINAESSDSLAVANHFIHLRDIPASNVVYVSGITHMQGLGPDTSRSRDFSKQVVSPVMTAIKDRGLTQQISCITYSAGIPTRISASTQVKKFRQKRGLAANKVWFGQWASATSLTYLYEDIFSSEPKYFLETNTANRYEAIPDHSWLKNPFTGELAKQFDTANQLTGTGDYLAASKILTELQSAHPRQIAVIFAKAKVSALQGDVNATLKTLSHAVSQGLHLKSVMLQDSAFAAVRNNPKFDTLIASVNGSRDLFVSTRNFSAGDYWSSNGWPNGTTDQGRRYFLSTVLAVVGERRSTLKSALAQIDRSCRADGTHPKATVYFAKHKDVRSRARTPQFDAAAAELLSLGHEAIIGTDPIVKNQKAVIGATLGSSDVNLAASKSHFAPGAICDNLTSYGGCWWPKFQTKLTDYLNAGAAGASGTICEPYAISNKFPSAKLHVHYARGCTLAESFYQAVKWPFQLLIVGDPLCCPYGNFPKFEIKGIQDGETITEDFVLRVEPKPDAPTVAHYELFYDGVFLTKVINSNQIKVETEAITDGYHELRIVGVTDSPIANRHSESVGFLLNRHGHTVDLSVASSEVSLGQILRARAVSSNGNQLQILQNSRTISKVENDRNFIIRTGDLGLGKTKLQAVSTLPNGQSIKSQPVSVSIVSHGRIQEHEKLAPPNKSELKKTIATIRELLKDKYKNTSVKGRQELLKLLRKTADESTSDPVKHFALLSECHNAAAVFGDVDTGWSACDQIDADYQTDQLPHLDFIKQIKTNLDQKSVRALFSRGVGLSEQLIDADRFNEVGSLARSLGSTVKKFMPAAQTETNSLIERSKLLARKFKLIQEDINKLTKDPSHPRANGKVGEFYCLLKNDFEQGLPYLAKGPTSPLQKLAKDELSLKTPTPEQRLEIADRWWELSQNKKLSGLQPVALKHYQEIVTKLKGLAKIKVEQRIEEVLSNGSKAEVTVLQLTNHHWNIEWSHGWIWENVNLNKNHLTLTSRAKNSTNSLPYKLNFKETPSGLEAWTKDKATFYQILFLDGRLICSKLNPKTNEHAEGLGSRIRFVKDK